MNAFTYELTYGTSSALGAFLIGLSNQQWAGGSLPQDLGGRAASCA